MKTRLETIAALLICAAGMTHARTPAYLDDTLPLETRVKDALSRMTTAEKIAIIHAQSKFSSPGVQRLGIPGIWCTDGPHGIRPDVLWDEWTQAGATNDSCVAFPALTCLAATWNPEMSALYGRSIGEEARYRNKNVLLGPGVNIYRTPLNGRNFEYMGEDPYLSSRMVVPYIKGVQDNGVAACVKHYALNNQESDRDHVNVLVDDRTLHEIYLPAFKAAVTEGCAWSIMPGYNKYDGAHACENRKLLLDILKDDWNFDGVAISDWGAVHNTEKVASNGLDMEFGSWTNGLNWGASNAYDDYYLAKPYGKLINEGKLPMSDLDDKAARVLRLIMRTEMRRDRPFGEMNSDGHYAAHADNDSSMYPGVNGDVYYKEGLDVGYRHTDRLKPSHVNYAFGHGLSYTTFRMGKPSVSSNRFSGVGGLTVTVPVTNTGDRDGAEVVQAYVRDCRSSVYRPLKELKAFSKVWLKPGQTGEAKLDFDRSAFAFYEPETRLWTIEPGRFEILIDNASDNILYNVAIDVDQPLTWKDSE